MAESPSGRSITDYIAAAGVIVGLSFVGYEIRQNTAAVRGAAYQELTASTIAGGFGLANDAELTEIFVRWFESPDSLDSVERMRFRNAFLGIARNVENAFHQHRVGTLDTDLWRGYAESFRGFTDGPEFPQLWADLRIRFSTDFQMFVDTALVPQATRGGS